MRVQTIVIGLIQAALLMACEDRSKNHAQAARDRAEAASNDVAAASPVPLGQMGQPAKSSQEASVSATGLWSRSGADDLASRLIIRTGQASIEVDSLEPSMAELRRIVQRVGGFVADASVQSGRNQLRSATLQLKVPASRFDDLTQALEPLGRLQFVNVAAEDVSEEFVDLTARVANSRRGPAGRAPANPHRQAPGRAHRRARACPGAGGDRADGGPDALPQDQRAAEHAVGQSLRARPNRGVPPRAERPRRSFQDRLAQFRGCARGRYRLTRLCRSGCCSRMGDADYCAEIQKENSVTGKW
jgi:Domain of unknown function (DUF4349)